MRTNGSHTPRSPGSPNAGLIPNVTATLRSIQSQNNNALAHVISQLEAANDIQNELVNARAAHAQVSMDLRMAVDQNITQGMQLQQSKNELASVNVMLHAAREQMLFMERKIENAGAEATTREQRAAAAREADAKACVSAACCTYLDLTETHIQRQIEALSLALGAANSQILVLNNKLQSVTTAAAAIQSDKPATPTIEIFKAGVSSLQELDQWLSSALGNPDQDMNGVAKEMASPAVEPAEPTTTVSTNGTASPTQQSFKLPIQSRDEITQLVKSCFQASKDGKHQASDLETNLT
jgi:hypothetical protein